MSVTTWIFDHEHTKRITMRRQEFLDRLLRDIGLSLKLETVLDAGCGIGYFANHLAAQGFKVSGFDGREENVLEAQRRTPQVQFYVQNVEDPNLEKLGQFDLVACFGLLYHLENPFLAVRNLYSVTGDVLIVETMVAPSSSPGAVLINEIPTEDQALNYIALIPSETAVINMLYAAGFKYVYQCPELPQHEEFQDTDHHRQRRTVLVASKSALSSPLLREAKLVHQSHEDVWRKTVSPAQQTRRRAANFAKKVRVYVRSRLILRSLWLTRLPWGAWWLAGPDSISKNLRSGRGFEDSEQLFLLHFLQPGMTMLDIGAHRGLYSLLASKRVGHDGKVISFEPSPRERSHLQRNLMINRYQNVQVEALGVGKSEGTATLYVVQDRDTGCNSMRPPDVPSATQPIEVPILPLDHYLASAHIQKVDFIKMDIEGAELDALEGATQLLTSKPRPIILYEISDLRTAAWDYKSVQLYDWLADKGFKHFALTAKGRLVPAVRKDEYDENLVAVPEEKLADVAAWVDKV